MDLEKKDIEGIIFAICACLCVAIMIAIVRKTSQDLHVTQILMMRCFFSLLLFVPSIIRSNGKIFHTKKLELHLLRSTTGFIAMLSWFYVVTQIPLPEAVSITFIVPILTMVAAVVILKEDVSKRIWVSLFLGMAGVIIIIRPGFEKVTVAHFISLLSAIIWAFSNILTKKLTTTDRPSTVALYLSVIVLLMSIPFAAPYLKSMNFEQLVWLFLLGLSANVAHISLSTAYTKTSLSILQPFDFTRLIFVSIIAYFAFGELVDIYMVIGSIVIIFSSFYLSLSKRMVKKPKPHIL